MGIESSNRYLAVVHEGMQEIGAEVAIAVAALEAAAAKMSAAHNDVSEEASELLRAALLEDLQKALARTSSQIKPDYQSAVGHLNDSGIGDMEVNASAQSIFDALTAYDSLGEEYTTTVQLLTNGLNTLPPKYAKAEEDTERARNATLEILSPAGLDSAQVSIHGVASHVSAAREALTTYMGPGEA